MEEETGDETLIDTPDNDTVFSVDGLHPYYRYNISVAAVTVGKGPFSEESYVQMPQTGLILWLYIVPQMPLVANIPLSLRGLF